MLSSATSDTKPLNSYFIEINDYLTDSESTYPWLSSAIDTIGLSSLTARKQHLRCFFDMELDPTNRALLLATPFYTGKQHLSVWQSTSLPEELATYANSSILVSFLDTKFDYNNNMYVYTCENDVYHDDIANVDINNIANS